MASFNKVILAGNITRDPELRHTPSGAAVLDIGLAVNRTWFDKKTETKKEDVAFIDVTFWARQAEVIAEYCSKGSSILVEGRLEMDQWEDKESGKKRSKLKVTGENFQFLGSKNGNGNGGGGSQSPEHSVSHKSAPPDDDIPF